LIRREGFVERHPSVAQAWLLQCPGVDETFYRRRVEGLFADRYPASSHDRLHRTAKALDAAPRTAFMMRRLLTGEPRFNWHMSPAGSTPGAGFFTGIATIEQLVAAHWLAALEPGHAMKKHFEPWTSRQLYNTFAEGYYEANVEPGGVGRAYDSVSRYYDAERARRACPRLMRSLAAGKQNSVKGSS